MKPKPTNSSLRAAFLKFSLGDLIKKAIACSMQQGGIFFASPAGYYYWRKMHAWGWFCPCCILTYALWAGLQATLSVYFHAEQEFLNQKILVKMPWNRWHETSQHFLFQISPR